MASHPGQRIHALFGHEPTRRLWVRLKLPIILLLAAAVVLNVDPDWFVAGLCVSAVGALFQLWCFSCINTKKTLAIHGPYTMMRNPMYIARYILMLGGLMLVGNVWVLLAFTVVYYFYMVNRVAREEELLRGIFGEPYASYCRRVNRFLPWYRPAEGARLLYANRSYFLRNHGYWNALFVASVYVAAWVFISSR